MSNLPPNPFNSVPGAPQVNANPAAPVYNHFQQFSQVPSNQLPPGYTGLKQDANSNSPLHAPTSVPQNSALQNVNHYNQSSSSSPAFNQPGMIPSSPQNVLQSSPMKPPISMVPPKIPLPSNPLTSGSPRPLNANPSPNNFGPNFPPQHNQINDNTPPLVPTSQFNQPLVNGPPTSSHTAAPVVYNTPPMPNRPLNTGPTPLNTAFGPPPVSNSMPSGTITSQPTIPFSSALTGPPRNSPLMQGPPSVSQFNSAPVSGPTLSQSLTNGPPLGPQRPIGTNGPPMSGLQMGPPTQKLGPIGSTLGPQGPPLSRMPQGPSAGMPQGPPAGMPQGPPAGMPQGPPTSGPALGLPRGPGLPPPPSLNGPQIGQPPYTGPPRNGPSGLMSTPGPPTGPPSGPQSLPPHFAPIGPPTMNQGPSTINQGPPKTTQGPPIMNQGPPIMNQGPPLMNQGPPIMNQGPPLINQGPPTINQGPPKTSQGPPVMNQGPPIMNQGPPLMNQGPPIMNQGPPLMNQGPPTMNQGPPTINQGPPTMNQGPPTMNQGPPTMNQGPPTMNQGPSVMNQQGPPKSNMQGRYPQMPQSSYNQPPQPGAPNMGNQQYPQPYNAQAMTQQMGQLSVTKQGFDQLWGHHMVDLLQCRNVLPEYPEDPPEIKLGHQFAEASNCSPEIFRCTINRIPESNSLLQKSRLPLGILIHPFKDINHLPVIQCNTIVRCRACRTYINPFVYFVDAKRWKCNLCYRVNDLPDEFQYDPVSKSYGDPSRRPEIKSATIEFIAPGEYMLRPPQPAVYLFLLDVSQLARDSGYLQVVCSSLQASLEQVPGDARTTVGFLCYDVHVHYYLMSEGLTRPKECTVLDVDDVFLPSPDSLLVNLGERRELVRELLTVLPQRFAQPGSPGSALGAALQAAYKLMAPTGGRITVFQTCLPNVGPGALQPREDPNARSSKDVAHLNPATDFYKRLALDCCGAQVAVDLFLLNSQYSDLATLSGMSKFSGGSVYHIPLFKASRKHHAEQLDRMLNRYLTRKIGFEAVMRVRCTRGITIHTFHGNFFVRSTDLLSLPNVSPDAGFGMQLTIEESLADLQQVCFQAALLYTSSKGERRIRVHTLALPIANTLPDVLHAADQHCIIGLLSKMAVDRALSASLPEAREALMHVAVEALGAHRLAHNLPAAGAGLLAPATLRLLPLLLLATLKRKAFRTGTSTRLDDRVFDMCAVKAAPLSSLLQGTYPTLYAVHELHAHTARTDSGELLADPPHLHLTAERVNSTGAYLLDDGESMLMYVCCNVSPAFLSETFGVAAFNQLPDELRELPRLSSPGNSLLHSFLERLNDERPYPSDLLILRDNSPSRQLFTERLVDDRVESAFSYYEFLQHVKNQVK